MAQGEREQQMETCTGMADKVVMLVILTFDQILYILNKHMHACFCDRSEREYLRED